MSLSFRDRLRLAWDITWPFTLIDMAVVVLIHGVLNAPGEFWDTAWALVAFFGVSPWIVKRGLGRWNIVSVSKGVVSPRLPYQQSLKVMWLLAWRTIPLALLALLAVSATFRATGVSLPHVSADDPLVNSFGLSLIDMLTSLALYPFLFPGMLRKRYRGFHLEVRPRV